MKSILFSFGALVLATSSYAQACFADPSLTLSSPVGIYPAIPSDGNNTTTDRDTIKLCLGQPWEFVFSAVVPDSITSPAHVNLETINVTSIAGLPIGLAVVGANSPINSDGEGVSATDQIFSDKTIGCISVAGTPTVVGYNPLTISFNITGDLNIPSTMPGTLFNAQFVFHVSDAPGCVADTYYWQNVLAGKSDNLYLASATPNPTTGMTTIEFGSKIESSLTFSVVNTLGEVVHNETIQANKGVNNIRFDASNLATGVYFYSISNGMEKTTKRLAVVRM